jgi:hypothetical protein
MITNSEAKNNEKKLPNIVKNLEAKKILETSKGSKSVKTDTVYYYFISSIILFIFGIEIACKA